MAISAASSQVGPAAEKTARNALIILTCINLFNYLDRLVVPSIFIPLTTEFGLNDAQLGAIPFAFLAVYAITSPIFGTYGDRSSRPRLLAIGIFVWSLATALGGLVGSFVGFMIARAVVGVGEAAYGSIAPAMLSDFYPKSRRGKVLAIFYLAIPVGSALGYVVGDQISAHYGWRAALLVAGIPGLILAYLAYRLPDPERGSQDESGHGVRGGELMSTARVLRKNYFYSQTVWGYAAYTFALGALANWMPSFLNRAHGLPLGTAGTVSGGILIVTGIVGTIGGSWIAERMAKKHKHPYLLLSGIATLCAAPFAYVALSASSTPIYVGALVIAEILIFASTGPVNSAIINYVEPHQRATAMALSILVIHATGDIPSPLIVGLISKQSSLQQAVQLIPVAVLISGIIWTRAGMRGNREMSTPG